MTGCVKMTAVKKLLSGRWNEFKESSTVVAIPITLLFLKMQNYYVEGVTAGGVKG